MKRILIGLAALAFTICPAMAEDIKKITLDPATITPKIETEAAKAGEQPAIKVTVQWPTIISLGEVTGLNIDDAKLIYTAKVKTDLEAGTAFLEMWVDVNGRQYFSRGMNDAVGKKTDWKTIGTPFILQKGQKATKATLNLIINGHGTVWVNDAVLAKEPR